MQQTLRSPQLSLAAPVVLDITSAIVDPTMTHDDNYANDNDIGTASESHVNVNGGGEKHTGEYDD